MHCCSVVQQKLKKVVCVYLCFMKGAINNMEIALWKDRYRYYLTFFKYLKKYQVINNTIPML